MNFKDIQVRLEQLKEQIQRDGRLSEQSEQELQGLIHHTILVANDELHNIQLQVESIMQVKSSGGTSNDNEDLALTQEQKLRLAIAEKTGIASSSIH